MIYDFVWHEMEECNADGVDFIPLSFNNKFPLEIYSSFTKKQWETESCILKTGRKYWKIDKQGRKVYIE